jgi:tRNA threonylcarbamoyl adenosine modification protein YeaZ
MLSLCADSSGQCAAFTLYGENVCDSLEIDCSGRASDIFVYTLEKFLNANSIRVIDIDKWIAITGPGSFTGVRVCMATLSAISLAVDKPLLGLMALDAAAIIANTDEVSVACPLRINEYAVKDFHFTTGLHSNIYIISNIGESMKPDIMINYGAKTTKGFTDLTKAITFDCERFLTSAEPVYVALSQAEVNFDKKSHC